MIKIGLLSPFPPKKDGIAIHSNNLITHINPDNIKIIKIGDKNSKADYKLDFHSFNLKNNLKRIIKKERLNLLHIQYVPTLFGKYNLNLNLIKALKQDISVVTTLHEVYYHNKGLRNFILSWIAKQLIKKSKIIIVHTPQQKRFLENKYKMNNVRCIYQGLNLWKQHKRKNKNILFFGFITPLKGIEYLINAMRELKEYKLIIAGSIPRGVKETYKNEIEKEIASLKNIETRIRWVPEKEKLRLYNWADIVVLPYIWAPYQSAVLHNAIASGLPVVVTKTGSLHEIVKLFNLGETAKPKNSKSLAEAIENIFKNYSKYKKGIKNYQRKANWKEIAKQHKVLYKSLI